MDKEKKILIVDDSELMRMKIYHMLVDKFDEENLLFSDTIENAREKVFKNNISLILLDIYLPGENGADFINDLLNNKRLKDIPIIVITATAPNSFVKASFEKHVNSYLHKPIDKTELLDSIQNVLN
jgi:CheY-like chemotaxis protein